jgi:hypothetical protein
MKYRKKPVVIEAVLLEDKYQSIVNAIEFVFNIGMETSQWGMNGSVSLVRNEGGFVIPTLEGDMKVSFGDYIIKGIQGEIYPCRADIFHKTYEKVE